MFVDGYAVDKLKIIAHAHCYCPGTAEQSAASVSISHCRNLAALAVSPAGNPLGIDIERPRRQLATVAPRVLSPSELDYYSSFPSGLLQAWTLKEALYKAAGITGADFARQLRIPLPGHEFATAVKPSGEEIRFSVLFSAPIGFMPVVGSGKWKQMRRNLQSTAHHRVR